MVTSEEIRRKLEEKREGGEGKELEEPTSSEGKKYCAACGIEYSEDSRFCTECGSELEEHPQEVEEVEYNIPDDMIIVSSNYVPGYKARENLGFVYGLTVRSRGLGGQIGAGIRSMFGGEIKEYVQMMAHSRDEALERLVEHAKGMGANAIISVRFDSNDISDIMQEILAYGTAVIVEKE